MIQNLGSKIVKYLVHSGAISDTDDEKEYYKYGIEITISSILNIILVLSIGIIAQSIIESIIFLILFIPLRQFTGGFHASSYLKCNISFCTVFTLLLVLYHLTQKYLTSYISILITFVCVAVIILRCPIENKNKPIPDNRKRFHKIMAALLGTVYGVVGTVLTVFSNKYGALVLYTLLLVVILVIAAILCERWNTYAYRKESG